MKVECDCPLPAWLEAWACETCDWESEYGVCECFDMMAMIDRFRQSHPHLRRIYKRKKK